MESVTESVAPLRDGETSGGADLKGAATFHLPWSTKFGWASGTFGVAIMSNAAAALMLFYLTTVVGLAGWIAGLVLMISKLYDIVSDPLAGWLSDRHQSPAGRRRPFMLIGALVNTAAIFLIFTVPFHGDRPAVWLYVLAVNLIYTTGYSLFNVPLLAMAPEITDDYHERSVLQGWRVMFSSVGSAIAITGSGAILGFLGHRTGAGGRVVNSARDYTVLAVMFAVLTCLGMMTSWRVTRNARIVSSTRTTASWRMQIRSFFGNKPALVIIGVKAAQLIGLASTSSAVFFMLVQVLKRTPADVPLIGLTTLAVSVIATPILSRWSKTIGKRGGYLIGSAAYVVSALSWIFAEPSEPLYWLVFRGALTGISFAGNVMFSMSMLNDAMELDSHRTGLRREGMYAALYSFVEKFGAAVGPAIVGGALSIAGFDKTASVTVANASAVRQAALVGVAYVPAACCAVAVLLLFLYRLDQRSLDEARGNSLIGLR